MSEWLAFVRLGLAHITDVRGADHILFLVALAAAYRLDDWREAAWVATAFTVGHSITLALAITGVLPLSAPVVEFLIPVTIVVTTAETVMVGRRGGGARQLYRPALAGVFGLVHGAGFANYLASLFVSDLAVPLLGFNVGLELGQIMVLALAALALSVVDRALAALVRRDDDRLLTLRVALVSLCVAGVALRWAVERAPW